MITAFILWTFILSWNVNFPTILKLIISKKNGKSSIASEFENMPIPQIYCGIKEWRFLHNHTFPSACTLRANHSILSCASADDIFINFLSVFPALHDQHCSLAPWKQYSLSECLHSVRQFILIHSHRLCAVTDQKEVDRNQRLKKWNCESV